MSAQDDPFLNDLPRGHRFAAVSFRLSAEDVRRYLAAVEDTNAAYFDADGRPAWAPPLAAAAYTLKAVLDQARLPDGTLHVAQELDFRRPVPVDADLTAVATLAQRSDMRGMAVCVIEFDVRLADGETAVAGRSTAMAPLSDTREAARG